MALHGRVRQRCEAGRGRLIASEGPCLSSDGVVAQAVKSLVVRCVSAEGGSGAVLCVLPLARRLCFAKLCRVLAVEGSLRPVGLAEPPDAAAIAGCAMGLVPPICLEPRLPILADTSLFAAGASPWLLGGAGDDAWRLQLLATELLLEGARVAEIATEGRAGELAASTPTEGAGTGSESDSSGELTAFLQTAAGPALHVVAVVAGIRRVSKELAFVDLVPPGLPPGGGSDRWRCPHGSGRRMRLQLIIGRSLVERIGGTAAAAVIKKVRCKQLLYVAGRMTFEDIGEQTNGADSLPEEVRQKRQAQFDNGIIDMVAEQLRLLEEVHSCGEVSSGTGKAAGMPRHRKQDVVTESGRQTVEEYLDLMLPWADVRLVEDLQGLELFADDLHEQLLRDEGHAVAEVEMAATCTAPTAVVGVDAEWQPGAARGTKAPVALLQLAFRRSIWLLDLLALRVDHIASVRAGDLLRLVLSSERLLKVGFGVAHDLARLGESFPGAWPEAGARGVVELQAVARAALPGADALGGLSGLCRTVFGRGLDKSQQTSHWGARPLSEAQLRYAAQDAHVCVRLFDTLVLNHSTLAMQPLLPTLCTLTLDLPVAAAAAADMNAAETNSDSG